MSLEDASGSGTLSREAVNVFLHLTRRCFCFCLQNSVPRPLCLGPMDSGSIFTVTMDTASPQQKADSMRDCRTQRFLCYLNWWKLASSRYNSCRTGYSQGLVPGYQCRREICRPKLRSAALGAVIGRMRSALGPFTIASTWCTGGGSGLDSGWRI